MLLSAAFPVGTCFHVAAWIEGASIGNKASVQKHARRSEDVVCLSAEAQARAVKDAVRDAGGVSCRKAKMISDAVHAAWAFLYHQNGINTLAFSSFVLLVYEPMAMFDPGFQLSYLAVLGLIIFQQKWAALLNFNFRLAFIYREEVNNTIIARVLATITSGNINLIHKRTFI